MQALRGEGLILRQEVCNFFHVELLDRLMQVFQQGSQNRRDGWNLAQSIEPLKEDLFARCGCHNLIPPFSERSPFT